MDKNKFWLGGRLFNMASPRLGTPTQRKARPQDGHPNATQGTSASWAPQCNARHVRKLGALTHVRNAIARHVRTSASWAPQCNERHVRKMVAQTQKSSTTKTSTQGSTRLKDELERPQVGCPNACPECKRKARPQVGRTNAMQGTSASWAPKRKSHPQRKHPHKGALG
jgi:hypothetical protein